MWDSVCGSGGRCGCEGWWGWGSNWTPTPVDMGGADADIAPLEVGADALCECNLVLCLEGGSEVMF